MYADGGGLYLQVTEGGASWLYRYMLAGRAREMGLGPLALFGLSEARSKALEVEGSATTALTRSRPGVPSARRLGSITPRRSRSNNAPKATSRRTARAGATVSTPRNGG
jgi:hypothetical protein